MKNLNKSDADTPTPQARPRWFKWLIAVIGTLLIAPLCAPLLWILILKEVFALDAVLFGLIWTYMVGLPFVAFGLLLLVSIWLIWYRSVVNWSTLKWLIVGAMVGLAILGVILFGDGSGLDMEIGALLFLINGPIVGAAATFIFRKILLR